MKRLQGEVLECVKVSSLFSVNGENTQLPVLQLECLATSLKRARMHVTLTARGLASGGRVRVC